jgi:hypothetical protein
MFGLLGQHYHFPGGSKDSFIALFLPKFDVKCAIRKFVTQQPRSPFGRRIAVFFTRMLLNHKVLQEYIYQLSPVTPRRNLANMYLPSQRVPWRQ